MRVGRQNALGHEVVVMLKHPSKPLRDGLRIAVDHNGDVLKVLNMLTHNGRRSVIGHDVVAVLKLPCRPMRHRLPRDRPQQSSVDHNGEAKC